MVADYKIQVWSTAGTTLQYEFTDFLYISATRIIQEVGMAQFAIIAEHPAMTYLVNNSLVEIWRRDPTFGVDWYRHWWGFAKNFDYSFDHDANGNIVQVTCVDRKELLRRRIVAWYAETANRSAFTSAKAETIANTLVKYNAGSLATVVNGRLRDGAITGLSIEADGAGGNTINWNCAYANLLETLQGISLVGGGQWDVVRAVGDIGEWRWTSPQLGTDKSATLIFSLENANIMLPTFKRDIEPEKTVAIVGGQGEASGRTIVVRTGANYNATSHNVESFVDYRNSNVTAALNSAGDKFLAENKRIVALDFEIIQTENYTFSADYSVGDLVTGKYLGNTQVMQVYSVNTDFEPGGFETMKIGLKVV